MMFFFLLIAAPVLASQKLICDEFINSDVDNIDLSELMEIPIFISASQQAECTQSAASIVSIISGEELLNMGARDLIDALELVPGFNFGTIVSNVVGLGVRGVQADEGKISVFVDGIMLTEQRFGTTAFGSHFPVEQIDRIEIIRGPGSILHGNFAELGVINIITKKGYQLNGGIVGGSYGRFEHGESRKTTHLTTGKKWDDWEVSFYGKYNENFRSDRIYQDAHGNTFNMVENNQLESVLGNFNIRYKDLNLRLLVDEYTVDSRDSFADTITAPDRYQENRFATYAAKLDYQYEISEYLKIDSGFDFSHQTPWQRTRVNLDAPDQLREKVSVDSYKFDLKATFSATEGHYAVLGNSFQFQDYQQHKTTFTGDLPFFANYTIYGEGVYKTDWVNILAGLRFDWYSEYGTNLAPRIALTKQLGDFHYKALYSHAFHAPTGGNFQLNAEYNQTHGPGEQVRQISPEKTVTYELEFGYRFMRNLSLSMNLYYTEIDNFFVYTVDQNQDDFYINSDRVSTRGIESTLHYKHRLWGDLKLNYSFYQAVKDSSSNFKVVTADGKLIHKRMNISFPTHKVSVNHQVQLTPSFSFNHTLIFSSDRYGYSGSTLVHHNPIWVYNIYLRHQNSLIKGLEAGLGFYDIFNAQYKYVQLFNGGHPALPGNTRELVFKLSYHF